VQELLFNLVSALPGIILFLKLLPQGYLISENNKNAIVAKGSLFWFSYLRHSAKKGKHRMGEKGAESSFPLCTNASPSLLLLLNHMNIKKEARPKGNPSPAIVMSSYNKEQLLAWV